MGDNPEGKRCPAFAQEGAAAEAKKVWSCFPPIPGDTWLSLLGRPFVPHPLQGRCDQHLVGLMLLWTQAGMQLGAGIPGAGRGQDAFLSIPMNFPLLRDSAGPGEFRICFKMLLNCPCAGVYLCS